jgi:hypothetical protein
MTSKNKISLLIGSGISIKVGCPSVDKLTEIILKAGFERVHTQYFISSPKNDRECSEIQDFINFIHTDLLKIYHYVNYEDIYYTILNLSLEENGYFKDAAYHYLNIEYKKNFKEKVFYNYKEILEESLELINSAICENLILQNPNLDYLELIVKTITNFNNYHFNIFTLNYDLILESLLEKYSLDYCDGFEPQNGRMIFNNALFENDNSINFIKLHGSINWYFTNIDSKIVVEKSQQGHKMLTPSSFTIPERKILIGTYNKSNYYVSFFFNNLFSKFLKELNNSEKLLAVGFGFKDDILTQNIFNWLSENKSRKLVVVSNNIASCKISATGLMNLVWDEFTASEQIIEINKKIEDVNLTELIIALN